MNRLPKVVRIGLYGAVAAIAIDYFLKPTMNSSLKL